MSTRKRVVGGIAAGSFAMLLATAPMYFFTTPFHPHVVFWLMVCSLASFTIFLAAWFAVGDLLEGESNTIQSIDSSASNSGHQMAAGRDIIIHHAVPQPESAPALIATAEAKPPIVDHEREARRQAPTRLTLRINRRTEEVVFDYRQSAWRLAYRGEAESQTAFVLWVENEFPTQGNGRDLSDIIASVRAEQFDSITMTRAYWLNCPDNEVTITSGNRLGVLLGYFSGRETFVSYANPYPPPIHYNILDDGYRHQAPRLTLPLVLRERETAPLRITVTLAQMPQQTVIACKLLTITLPYIVVDMQECE